MVTGPESKTVLVQRESGKRKERTETATGFKRRSGWATVVHLLHRTQKSLRFV
jgi:hypothetical protein